MFLWEIISNFTTNQQNKFQKITSPIQFKKAADHYILDINDVWSTVDSNMTLQPNQMEDPENIETMFFLLMRQKLEDNKNREVSE